jgi:hypothetical protein
VNKTGDLRKDFLSATSNWVCDGYYLDVRYFAHRSSGKWEILSATLRLDPLPPVEDLSFSFEADSFCAGQLQLSGMPLSDLFHYLDRASEGKVLLEDRELSLPSAADQFVTSETTQREKTFYDLHLGISGRPQTTMTESEFVTIDNALRGHSLPFDGISELSTWLGLSAPTSTSFVPSLDIRVGPPLDVIVEESSLADDTLTIVLHAHTSFDTSKTRLAVRVYPGSGLGARRQVSEKLRWRTKKDRKIGLAKVRLEHADHVLVMLLIDGVTVRRQYMTDPNRVSNTRQLAVQHFDKHLGMVKRYLFDEKSAPKFEKAVAALAFQLGFAPCTQPQDDAPDIIAMTPNGRFVVIECTLKIGDFQTKLGKLVDRKESLARALTARFGNIVDVAAALVCPLPQSQIAVDHAALRSHRVILVDGDALARGLARLRLTTNANADAILDEALQSLHE